MPGTSGPRERHLQKLSAAVSSFQSSAPPLYRIPLVVIGALVIATPVFFVMQGVIWGPHVSQLRPPSCMLAEPTNQGERASLPMLYFMAGVEGSGHDFWERFFSYLPVNMTIELFEPNFHLTNDPEQSLPGGCSEEAPKMPYARHVSDFGSQISVRLAKLPKLAGTDRVFYVRARDPFSMGRVRTPLARPDLLNLALYDGIQYNLKVLVLVRNLKDTVVWSVSRNFHAKDVGLQARLIEDGMTYLDAQLRMLPCSSYAAINLDLLPANMETVSPSLATFLQVPGIASADVLKALRAAHSSWVAPAADQSPEFHGEPVEAFFSRRQLQWPLMLSCRSSPFFQPKNPAHWPS